MHWATIHEYIQDSSFQRKMNWGGMEAAEVHLEKHYAEYLGRALKKSWFRIFFTPWVFNGIKYADSREAWYDLSQR